MNVLMLVLTMLMLLAVATHMRMESFLDANRATREYRTYMALREREVLQKKARDHYNSITRESGESGGARLSSRLDIRSLFDASQQQGDAYRAIREVFQRLLTILLDDPDTAQQIAAQLEAFSQRLDAVPIKEMDGLAEVEFQNDPEERLRELYIELLEGNGRYPALSNYVTLQHPDKRVSLYLAKRELLEAILEDVSLVADILVVRRSIFQSYQDDEAYRSTASERLRQLVEGHPMAALFDPGVSGTKPPN